MISGILSSSNKVTHSLLERVSLATEEVEAADLGKCVDYRPVEDLWVIRADGYVVTAVHHFGQEGAAGQEQRFGKNLRTILSALRLFRGMPAWRLIV